ncbi:hypothetical protein DBR06_SOUSAS4810051, partial [Sousa chinensis]
TAGVYVGQLLSMGCQERLSDLGRLTPAIGVDLALPLFYVSTALFHPVLDSIVLSLATPIPRDSRQK